MAPPRGLFLSLPTPEKDSRSGFRNATQALQDAADTLPMGAAPAGSAHEAAGRTDRIIQFMATT